MRVVIARRQVYQNAADTMQTFRWREARSTGNEDELIGVPEVEHNSPFNLRWVAECDKDRRKYDAHHAPHRR